MNFQQIIIPAFPGSKLGYSMGDSFSVLNGDIKCTISIDVTSEALDYWSRYNLRVNERNNKNALIKFSEKNFEKFRACFIGVMNNLIHHYRGFPSPIYKTKRIAFFFDESDAICTVKNTFGKFEVLSIRFNIFYARFSQSRVREFIKHELFHVVAEMHEGQKNTIIKIGRRQDRLKSAIDENKKTVDNGVKEILDYCKRNSLDHRGTSNQVEASIGYFYQYASRKFWNLVSDSALCVIAMELNDIGFIRFWIRADKKIVDDLIHRLKRINDVMGTIKNNELDKRKRNFLMKSLNLLQFITCFEGMPFFAVAYGILKNDGRSKRNISYFKKTVRTYCAPKVTIGFLRFYDSYLHIIKAQAIHNDPLNPDITQQIHNTECLTRGKDAYITLNREFYKLFRELKKYE